jgi:hypothetical protein
MVLEKNNFKEANPKRDLSMHLCKIMGFSLELSK